MYIEAPIDLDKLSEVTKYEENTVLNTERYQVIVRLVRLLDILFIYFFYMTIIK